VNGDDLGLSLGVNRGIVEACVRGILTSASLLVDRPATEDALERVVAAPGLSLGLHVDLADAERAGRDVQAELSRQVQRFTDLVGAVPAHIDSHHNDHRRPEMLPLFSTLARECGAPLRGQGPIHSLMSFYGQWDGESHPEQIGVDGLARILEAGVIDGITELACHPGYVDGGLHSSYTIEREIELATLCDPRSKEILRGLNIDLVTSSEAAQMLRAPREGVEEPSTRR
jgi:chitin disaccharide deacetylase